MTQPSHAVLATLTSEQEAQLVAFGEKWRAVAFSTAAANRPRAEAGVRRIYEAARLPPPAVVWVASPLAIAEQWLTAMRRHDEAPGDTSRRSTVSVRGAVRRLVRSRASDLERRHVGETVRRRVHEAITAPIAEAIDEVRDAIWTGVVDALSQRGVVGALQKLRDEVGDCYRDPGSGQHDAAWLARADFYGSACGLPDFVEVTSGMLDLAESAGWFSPQLDVCWISERPSRIRLASSNRAEADVPVVVYPDGFAIHAPPDASGARPEDRELRRWRFGL